jgi:hypothetical protein
LANRRVAVLSAPPYSRDFTGTEVHLELMEHEKVCAQRWLLLIRTVLYAAGAIIMMQAGVIATVLLHK